MSLDLSKIGLDGPEMNNVNRGRQYTMKITMGDPHCYIEVFGSEDANGNRRKVSRLAQKRSTVERTAQLMAKKYRVMRQLVSVEGDA